MRFPIEVYPSNIIIPPHEYRHVTLAFCPKALQHYNAVFEAVAVGGAADPTTASFTCELRGEGALPSLNFQVRRYWWTAPMRMRACVAMFLPAAKYTQHCLCVYWQEPNILDSAGRPWLKFGKLTTPGQSRQLLINVRNNGLLPATARIEMEPHPAFKLLVGNQVLTVESKKAATFTAEFVPPEQGSFSHELHLNVNNNPFEQHKVALTGEEKLLLAFVQPVLGLHAFVACKQPNILVLCIPSP